MIYVIQNYINLNCENTCINNNCETNPFCRFVCKPEEIMTNSKKEGLNAYLLLLADNLLPNLKTNKSTEKISKYLTKTLRKLGINTKNLHNEIVIYFFLSLLISEFSQILSDKSILDNFKKLKLDKEVLEKQNFDMQWIKNNTSLMLGLINKILKDPMVKSTKSILYSLLKTSSVEEITVLIGLMENFVKSDMKDTDLFINFKPCRDNERCVMILSKLSKKQVKTFLTFLNNKTGYGFALKQMLKTYPEHKKA